MLTRRVAIVLAAGIALAACSSKGTTTTTASSSGASTTAGSAATTTSTTAAPTTTTTIPIIHQAGTGKQATAPFTVAGGLTVFHSTCASCQANFSVELLDSASQTKDVIVNTIGTYDGSKGEGLGAGNYSLKIEADAAWTVAVLQPRHPGLPPLPQTFTGKRDQFVGPFDAAHAARMAATNTAGPGGGNFAVEVLDSSGATQDVAFNEIGSFHGSTVSQMTSQGPYFLDVTSDGTWTINLTKP